MVVDAAIWLFGVFALVVSVIVAFVWALDRLMGFLIPHEWGDEDG